jgi:CRP/FNR family transcriptional regulator
MIPIEALKHYPHFSSISNHYIKQIAMISHEIAFEKGEKLFREGNTATHLMFLRSGEIDIVYLLGDGREVIADTLVTGDTLAWSSVLAPHRLTATGIGNKGGSLILIEAEGLRKLCDENTDFGYSLMREIAATLRSRLSAMRVQAAVRIAEPSM